MPASIIDSHVFGTRAMRRVWSDESRTAHYLAVERALALVQGRLGIVPQEAAAEIARKYRDTPMAGRSNLQQAIADHVRLQDGHPPRRLERHRERLAQLQPRVLVGELPALADTLASIEPAARWRRRPA